MSINQAQNSLDVIYNEFDSGSPIYKPELVTCQNLAFIPAMYFHLYHLYEELKSCVQSIICTSDFSHPTALPNLNNSIIKSSAPRNSTPQAVLFSSLQCCQIYLLIIITECHDHDPVHNYRGGALSPQTGVRRRQYDA